MKKLILSVAFLLIANFLAAQSIEMQVNGETRELTYEVKGELGLLVDDSSREYDLFVKKNETVKELTEDNYLAVLSDLTSDKDIPTDELELNLRDVRNFVLDYNAKFNDEFKKTPPVSIRMSFLGGVSNYNAFLPADFDDNYLFQALSFELYNKERYNRHSLIVQARKSADQGDFDVDIFEIGIGYRFKIINSDRFHFYFETEFFNLHRVDVNEEQLPETTGVTIESDSDYEFEPPLGLGGGIAYQVTEGFYLTANYNNIVFLGLDDNDESPLDIRFGLKFDL